jgi:cysteine desulfuration protein SufE
MIYASCQNKQAELKNIFSSCTSPDARYQKIIEWGRQAAPLPIQLKTPANIVKGCQSTLYLHSFLQDGKVFFEVDSEALISLGLAALLIYVYNGESPETILKCPPTFIEDLQLATSLTPGRSNGLASMFLRMKQDALRLLSS